MIGDQRWSGNPVEAVKRLKEIEPDVERRAMTPAEQEALLDRSPVDRSVCYRLAIDAGLRRTELKKLLWGDLDIEGGNVTVRASTTKNVRTCDVGNLRNAPIA